MKRIGNLYDSICTIDALYRGFEEARRSKRTTRACHQFEQRLGGEIQALSRELETGAYQPLPYRTFMVWEPKPRTISAPAFRDRVVQHAIYNAIRPIFDRTFIDQSFACRVGRGTHAAADYVQHALGQVPRDSWVLQMDIRRYYYSLVRAILRGLIARVIKDERLVDLIMLFADPGTPLGVPIGNLLAQLFGLIYLNPLDHFAKRELGAKYYARYVDDFVLIGLTRDRALECRAAIEAFLAQRLRLSLSRADIFPVRRGMNFVGYRTWASRRFIRKRALYNFRQAAKRGELESVISSLGHARKTASHRYMLNYLETHHHGLYRQLPIGIRRLHNVSTQRP